MNLFEQKLLEALDTVTDSGILDIANEIDGVRNNLGDQETRLRNAKDTLNSKLGVAVRSGCPRLKTAMWDDAKYGPVVRITFASKSIVCYPDPQSKSWKFTESNTITRSIIKNSGQALALSEDVSAFARAICDAYTSKFKSLQR